MSTEWQWDDTVARPTHRDGKPIRGTEHIRFIIVGFAELLANLPDDAPVASDPSLRDYWPDVCDTCDVHEGHEPSCPNNRDDEEALPDDYDYRADYDGPLTEDDQMNERCLCQYCNYTPDAYDLAERNLWDAHRDAPDPDTYEQKEQPDQ